MRTMRAALLRAPRAGVEIAEVPVPQPGAGEVLIRLEACGVCHSDIFLAGASKLPKAPLVLGHEGVGVIEACGEGITGLRTGDRVGLGFLHHACGKCEYCAAGRENCCPGQVQTGYMVDGALAEYAIGSANYVARIPDGLSIEQAAPLCCAGLTAYRALKTAALQPGEWLAIFGIGGLGHIAIQLARQAGLRIAAVDIAAGKLEHAARLGAEITVNAAEMKPREALSRVGGAAAALVLTGSPAAAEQALATLKPGGILVLVGLSSESFALPLLKTVLQGLRVAGTLVGTREDLREVLRLAAGGGLTAAVETCRLEDVPEIFERMKRGEVMGRAVVRF